MKKINMLINSIRKIRDRDYRLASNYFDIAWENSKKEWGIEFRNIFVPAYFLFLIRDKGINQKLSNTMKNIFIKWAIETYPKEMMASKTYDELSVLNITDNTIYAVSKIIEKVPMTEKLKRAVIRSNRIFDEEIEELKEDIQMEAFYCSSETDISRNMRAETFTTDLNRFYLFLNTQVTLEMAREIEKKTNLKRHDFVGWVCDRFGKSRNDQKSKNIVNYQWNRAQPINRQPRAKVKEFIYSNMDEDGKLHFKYVNRRRVPDIKFFTAKEGVDLRTGSDLSANVPVSFMDWDYANGYGVLIGRIRISDMFGVYEGRQKDKDGNVRRWTRPANLTVEEETLLGWDVGLSMLEADGEALPMTLMAIKAGGKPQLLFTKVTKKHIKYAKNWRKYLDGELASGNITKEQDVQMRKAAYTLQQYGSKFPMAQVIARHEAMKIARYNKYMIDESVQGNYKRINLDATEGVVPVGIGERTVRIFDPTKVKLYHNGKEIKQLKGERYLFDGWTALSESYLRDMEPLIGRVKTTRSGKGLSIIKEVTRDRSANGENYIVTKSLGTLADEGMQWVADDGTVIAKTVKIKGRVEIVDETGNRIDKLMTINEAKNTAGRFRVGAKGYTGVEDISEEANRVIIVPAEASKRSASFVNQWLDILSHPEFADVRSTLTEHMTELTKRYVNRLFEMRKDPKKFKAFIMASIREGTTFSQRINKLVMPDGEHFIEDGYLHPEIVSIFINQILNSMLIDGSFKGRRFGKGSFLYLKPDLGNEIQSTNEIMVSAENTTIVRMLSNLSGEKTIEGINNWLATKPASAWVLTSRFPINNVPAVQMRRIIKLTENKDGDSVRLHPDDVFFRLQGDFDGDEIFIEFFDKTITKKLRSIVKKPAWKEKLKTVDLSKFKNPLKQTNYANLTDFYAVAKNVIGSVNSQGIITNAKSIRANLLVKNFRMTVEGAEIIPKGEDERVQMLYAPLNDDVELNPGDRIVNKDGKRWKEGDGDKFLETTSEHELAILMQAATDNTKEMLLGYWGYKGRDDFIFNRIFKRTDGGELTETQGNVIASLMTMVGHSQLRRGNDKFGTKCTMAELFKESIDVSDTINRPSEEQGELLKRKLVSLGHKKVSKVTVNGKPSPFEKFFSVLGDVFTEHHNSDSNDRIVRSPFGFSDSAYRSAVVYSVRKLFDKYQYVGKTTFVKARRIANEMMAEYLNIFTMTQKKVTEKAQIASLRSFDYESEINAFITKWKKKYAELGIDPKVDSPMMIAISIHAHNGGHRVKKSGDKFYLGRDIVRVKLLPTELVSAKVHYDFMSEFGKALSAGVNVKIGQRTNPFRDFMHGHKLECG